MSPEERLRARNKVGFGGMQDIRNAMKSCPQQLADCLRAMTIVRHTCSRLGTNIADRLRVNAIEALKGLKVAKHGSPQHPRKRVEYVGVMKSRWKRWRLWAHIAAMKIVAWVALIAGGGMYIEDMQEDSVSKPPTESGSESVSVQKPHQRQSFQVHVTPA